VLELNEWWADDPSESFWLEITDRDDIGGYLRAPQQNENADPYWSYELVTRVQAGDQVFHYDKNAGAVIAVSRASGEWWEQETLWAARGTSARESGIEPHWRAGWAAAIDSFQRFAAPVTLQDIRVAHPNWIQKLSALQARHRGALYFPFEKGEKRPTRGTQGYLFKLPRFFVDEFSVLRDSITDETSSKTLLAISEPEIGTPYREADEDTAVAPSKPGIADPATVERGLRGHSQTQNALALAVSGRGLDPRSPTRGEPNFDLAWTSGSELWVAEIKSITDDNEERQLRMGLGQILRYRHDLRKEGWTVRGVIVAEREPSDPGWRDVASAVDVVLVSPSTWESILWGRLSS
jgi:hypothetical protein